MRERFGFKKNKCKVRLPYTYSFNLAINNDLVVNYMKEKEISAAGFAYDTYIPAKGYDIWEVGTAAMGCDIPLNELVKYTAVASFSISPVNPLSYVPNVVIATVEIQASKNQNGKPDPSFYISVYNPTNFEMVFQDEHYLNITLIENV